MTLTTLDGVCVMKPINFAADGIDSVLNEIDTPETVAQIMIHNARLKELQKYCDNGKPVNLLKEIK